MRGGTVAPVVAGKRYAAGKNPGLAVVLSVLIPGVGQFYTGDVKKGALMLGIAVVGSFFTMGAAWLAMMIWSAIDSYNVAIGKSPLW
jgi:TM2 domain-containing membrane protein YozV